MPKRTWLVIQAIAANDEGKAVANLKRGAQNACISKRVYALSSAPEKPKIFIAYGTNFDLDDEPIIS